MPSEVLQNDVRDEFGDQHQDLFPRSCFPHHLEIRSRLKVGAYPVADYFVIIHKNDSD